MSITYLINFLMNNPCKDPNVLRVLLFIRKLLEIAFIAIPIVLIVLITFDFIKAFMANSEDAMKKNQKVVIKRLIYAVMLFFVMPIVNIVFSAFSNSGNIDKISKDFDSESVNYLTCWENAESIKKIESFIITATFDGGSGNVFGKTKQQCGGTVSCEISNIPNATKKGYDFTGWSNDGCDNKTKSGSLTLTKGANNNYTACWDKKSGDNSNGNSNITTINKNIRATIETEGYVYPLYDNQHDEDYKDVAYGSSTMYNAGCGVFSGAMVLAGLTNNADVTPLSYLKEIETYFPDYNSYFRSNVGSIYPGIYTDKFIEKVYNVKVTESKSTDAALKHLENGYPAVGTIRGHILAFIPAPKADKEKGAKFYVLDSIKRSTGAYKSLNDFKETNLKKNGERKNGWNISFSYLFEPAS